MATITEEAITKLRNEYKAAKGKLNKHGAVVAEPVLDALCDFCGQNAEFSQAVAQSGKSFKDCIDAVVKGVSSAISDLEVYRRAVAFYFDGATVRFQMTIDLGDEGFSNKETAEIPAPADKPSGGLSLSLDDLLF